MRPESCLDLGKSQADPGQKHGVEWNGMGCNTCTCFTGTGIYIIINTIPLEPLPVSAGSSQRFAVDMLLVDRVTALGEDARSPGQGVAHRYP